jgi:hypothetical protein
MVELTIHNTIYAVNGTNRRDGLNLETLEIVDIVDHLRRRKTPELCRTASPKPSVPSSILGAPAKKEARKSLMCNGFRAFSFLRISRPQKTECALTI